MYKKAWRDKDCYKEVCAVARFCRSVLWETMVVFDSVLKQSEMQKLNQAFNIISEASSIARKRMIDDGVDTTGGWAFAFNGFMYENLMGTPAQTEIHEIARKFACRILGEDISKSRSSQKSSEPTPSIRFTEGTADVLKKMDGDIAKTLEGLSSSGDVFEALSAIEDIFSGTGMDTLKRCVTSEVIWHCFELSVGEGKEPDQIDE